VPEREAGCAARIRFLHIVCLIDTLSQHPSSHSSINILLLKFPRPSAHPTVSSPPAEISDLFVAYRTEPGVGRPVPGKRASVGREPRCFSLQFALQIRSASMIDRPTGFLPPANLQVQVPRLRDRLLGMRIWVVNVRLRYGAAQVGSVGTRRTSLSYWEGVSLLQTCQ
jgi:hypothetical protein